MENFISNNSIEIPLGETSQTNNLMFEIPSETKVSDLSGFLDNEKQFENENSNIDSNESSDNVYYQNKDNINNQSINSKKRGRPKKENESIEENSTEKEIYNLIINIYNNFGIKFNKNNIINYANKGQEGFHNWLKDFVYQNIQYAIFNSMADPIVFRFNEFIKNGGNPQYFMKQHSNENGIDINILNDNQIIIYDLLTKGLDIEEAENILNLYIENDTINKIADATRKTHINAQIIKDRELNIQYENELINNRKNYENAIVDWYNSLTDTETTILNVKINNSLADEMLRYRFQTNENGHTQIGLDLQNGAILNIITLLGTLNWRIDKIIERAEQNGAREQNKKIFKTLNTSSNRGIKTKNDDLDNFFNSFKN